MQTAEEIIKKIIRGEELTGYTTKGELMRILLNYEVLSKNLSQEQLEKINKLLKAIKE